jgi:DNA-binding NtrC family response regulator
MSSSIIGRVLVVDDQQNWREALKVLLEAEGLHVSEADSFEHAENVLVQSVFDLVVLDVRLVDEDVFNVEGLGLLDLIKTSHPSTRVIILTGYPQSVKEKTEADAFVLKVPPGSTFESTEFRNLVIRLVRESFSTRNRVEGKTNG